MVCKKDGSWRPCGDYRRLNLATTHETHDRYPLPSILNLSNKLHGCKFFSCIDLVKGYHQIPMAAQDIAKTAIITPFGLFEFLFMPFGLRNAAQTFQHFMDSILKHLPFVFCYLDDIIIASNSLEEHNKHLRQIFTILQENSLQINPAKCVFAAAAVEFLGHRVDQDGVRRSSGTCRPSVISPPPSGCETITTVFRYGEFLQEIPSRYRLHAVLSLATDASDTHVGGMLQQLTGGRWQPLAFYSKKLSGAGTRYSTFDRELLVTFSPVRHFRFLLEGR
jgi:hypothetical protein